jgi:hypothetical protein
MKPLTVHSPASALACFRLFPTNACKAAEKAVLAFRRAALCSFAIFILSHSPNAPVQRRRAVPSVASGWWVVLLLLP